MDANGRMLDPVAGRFVSVDPVYQAPTNSQSVNPYSYVMNNPLSLVDPSGYTSNDASSTADSNQLINSGSLNQKGTQSIAGVSINDIKNVAINKDGSITINLNDGKSISISAKDGASLDLSGFTSKLGNGVPGKQQGTVTPGSDSTSGTQSAISIKLTGNSSQKKSAAPTSNDNQAMGFIPFFIGTLMCGCRDATEDTGEAINSTSLPGENIFLGGFKGVTILGIVGKDALESTEKTAVEGATKTVAGTISGYTKHGLNQVISRDGVGVSPKAIVNTVRSPDMVIDQANGARRYVSKDSVVILNKDGKVITAYARNSASTRTPSQ